MSLSSQAPHLPLLHPVFDVRRTKADPEVGPRSRWKEGAGLRAAAAGSLQAGVGARTRRRGGTTGGATPPLPWPGTPPFFLAYSLDCVLLPQSSDEAPATTL